MGPFQGIHAGVSFAGSIRVPVKGSVQVPSRRL